MIVTSFCKTSMNYTTTLFILTTIAISTSIIVGGIFLISNPVFAALCKTVGKQVVCKTSPDEVCTHYSPNQVSCTTRNFHNMISTS